MSPRVNRRRPTPAASGAARVDLVESWPDGDWAVRPSAGGSATKTYRCPGCDHQIAPAIPHLVAWPADGAGGPDARRHWHKPCWAARGRRGVTVQRSRNAPRYG